LLPLFTRNIILFTVNLFIMRPLILLLVGLLMRPLLIPAQNLGVIGSSTAAGDGASIPDSSWVNLTKVWYSSLGQLTNVFNLAVSGKTTFDGMPSSYSPPTAAPGDPQPPPPLPDHNVTKVLSDGSDVVIVAFPSNDITAGFTLTQYLSNLRTIYDSVVVKGKICYVTTTQPRDDIAPGTRLLLKQGRDSILAEFPGFTLNFWDPVVDPVSLGILAQYSFGDGIHFNNAGHQVLFQVVKSANIMPSTPLPLAFINFTAKWQQQSVLLTWTVADGDAPAGLSWFEIQRSADGSHFTSLQQLNQQTAISSGSFSWTDDHPLSGKSFYRVGWVQGQDEKFTAIAKLDNSPIKKLSIGRIYNSPGTAALGVEIDCPVDQTVSISVIGVSGALLRRQSSAIQSNSATIYIPIASLPAGQYFLKVTAANGDKAVTSFTKL
jgi:lysophospholipase L1-like esterase